MNLIVIRPMVYGFIALFTATALILGHWKCPKASLYRLFFLAMAVSTGHVAATAIILTLNGVGVLIPRGLIVCSQSLNLLRNGLTILWFLGLIPGFPVRIAGMALGLILAVLIPLRAASMLTSLIFGIQIALFLGSSGLVFLSLLKRRFHSDYRLSFLQSVALLTALFLVGLLLDFLESMPWPASAISFPWMDFYPLYFLALTLVFLVVPPWRETEKESRASWPESLTQREREIADGILRGMTNKELAEEFFIAESTVKKHVNAVFRKLRLRSRWELQKYKSENSPKVP